MWHQVLQTGAMQFSGLTTLYTQQMTQQRHVFGLLRSYRNVNKRQGNSLINTQRKVKRASDWQDPNGFQACKNNPRAADIDKSQRNKIKSTKVLLQKVSLTFSTAGNLQITRLMTYASISKSLTRREIFLEIDFSTALITVVKLIWIPSSQLKSGLFKELFSRNENTTWKKNSGA